MATEQEMVVKIAPAADIQSDEAGSSGTVASLTELPPTQVDEVGPSGAMASPTTEVSESMQVRSGEPQAMASFFGTTLELPTPSSADTPALIVLPIL